MRLHRLIACRDFEIVIAQLDADGLGDVALALQVACHLLAQPGEDRAQFGLVAHRMQVTLERCFAAHADRFALGHNWAVVSAPGYLVHPGAAALAELANQELPVLRGQLADGLDAQRRQLFACLGSDAIDLAHRQRPDAALQVTRLDNRNAVGLVELASHLGKQLVGRHAN